MLFYNTMKSPLLIIACWVLIPLVAYSAPGDLDPTLDEDGIVTTDLSGTGGESGQAVALQPDGKIIVGGTVTDTQRRPGFNYNANDFLLLRYNPDGTLDDTFGNGGIVTTEFSGFYTTIRDIALLPDGKIVAVGHAYDGGFYDFVVARYNADGSLDTTCSGDGKYVTAYKNSFDAAKAVAVQSDGKIIIVGDLYNGSGSTFSVVRLKDDCTSDGTFGNGGLFRTQISGVDNETAEDVAIQSDGKIIVVGRTRRGNGDFFKIVRLNTDGGLDSTFDGDGKVITGFGQSASAYAVAIQEDGKIMVGGNGIRATLGPRGWGLARYEVNGSLDTSFGQDGVVIVNNNATIARLVLQTDGKIVAVGIDDDEDGNNTINDAAIGRFNTDGSLDTSFDENGIQTIDIGAENNTGQDVALQADGNIVVVGYSRIAHGNDRTDVALIRIDTDPEISIDDVTVTENDSEFDDIPPDVFTVTLSAAHTEVVTVDYEIQNLLAEAGIDFVAAGGATTGTLTFEPGATSAIIEFWRLGDTLVEFDETFQVALSHPVNASLFDDTGAGMILNNDSGPAITIDDLEMDEPDANGATASATLTVSLSEASSQTIIVEYYTSSETASDSSGDYQPIPDPLALVWDPPELTFLPGETVKTIEVTVWGDDYDEDDEYFIVYLDIPDPVDTPDPAYFDKQEGMITLFDTDSAPSLVVNDVSIAEDGSSTVFTVSLSNPSGKEIRFRYNLISGTALPDLDYENYSGTEFIEAGATTYEVWIPILDDLDPEPIETFEINLFSPRNATLADNRGQATILDNDAAPLPTLTIGDASANEGGGGLIQLNLSSASAQTVTVGFATTINGSATPGEDFTVTDGTVTFLPGETSQLLPISLPDDESDEPDETVVVSFGAVSQAILANNSATLTITDNDNPPRLDVSDVSVMEIDAKTQPATFAVTLSVASGFTVTVDYTTGDGTALAGSDYNSVNGTLTFLPGQTTQQFVVDTLGDTTDEPDEVFTVALANASNATINNGNAKGTIVDNDASAAADDPEEPPVLNEPSDCLVIATNFVTGVECGRATSREGESFTVPCDASKAADPNDPTLMRIAITCQCDDVTLEKYFETEAGSEDIQDGEQEYAAGAVNSDETFATTLLREQLDEIGWDALQNNTIQPACFSTFMRAFLEDSAQNGSRLDGAFGTWREVTRCFMREQIAPSYFGFPSYPAMHAAMRNGELGAVEIESIALAAQVYCDMNPDEVETELNRARSAIEGVANLATTRVLSCDNPAELDAWIETVQALDVATLTDEESWDNLGEILEDFVEEAREDGDYTPLTDPGRVDIIIGSIEELLEGGGQGNREEAGLILEMTNDIVLEETDDPWQIGAALNDLVDDMSEETLREFEEGEQDSGLMGNYVASQVRDGHGDEFEAADADDLADNLHRRRHETDDCRERHGHYDDDCFNNLPLDELLDPESATDSPDQSDTDPADQEQQEETDEEEMDLPSDEPGEPGNDGPEEDRPRGPEGRGPGNGH